MMYTLRTVVLSGDHKTTESHSYLREQYIDSQICTHGGVKNHLVPTHAGDGLVPFAAI